MYKIKRRKSEDRKSTVTAVVEDAYSLISELASECRELVDNAPEQLQNSSRIQTFDETAGTLENYDSAPELPEEAGSIECCYSELLPRDKRRPLSRADRCANIAAMLHAAADAIQSHIDGLETKDGDGDDNDELRSALEEAEQAIQDCVSNIESCEFPGMFG